MYFDTTSIQLKNQIRENIFSLLGNRGKTLFSPTWVAELQLHFSWSERFATLWERIISFQHKKKIGYLVFVLGAFMMTPPDSSFAADTSVGNTQTFITTAYYSPLPGQSFYLQGNYAAEVRLNGDGTHGASGTPVFAGMLAAPKSYSFGTHIFFDGLGVGTVSDRGGAIVDAYVRGQAHDRIDIWMGHGETGLKRALAWGRREITGTFVSASEAKKMNPIDLEGISNGRVNLGGFSSYTAKPAAQWILSSDVIEDFADLGYSPVIIGTTAMILRFQLDHQVITSASEQWAGNFGPKTKAALARAHNTYDAVRDDELKAIEKAKAALLADHNTYQKSYNAVELQVSTFGDPHIGDAGVGVKNLQTFLQKNGFLPSNTQIGRMNGATITALRKYQKARWLTASGVIDEPTRATIIDDLVAGS